MEMPFWKNKYVFIFGTIFLLLIVLILSSAFSSGRANFLENGTGMVVSTITKVFHSIGNGLQEFGNYFSSKQQLADQVEELTKSGMQLKNEVQRLKGFQNENENLRNLLELKESLPYETVAAEVVSRDFSNWYTTFVIDKGSSSGLQKNQPVITSGGLVGYIDQVGTTWSKVVTILNPDVSVSSQNMRTGEIFVISGDMDLKNQGMCSMQYINKDSNLILLDVLETSGLGGIFPKGLIIGTVEERLVDVNSINQTARIKPAVDFGKVSEVLVIVNHTEVNVP